MMFKRYKSYVIHAVLGLSLMLVCMDSDVRAKEFVPDIRPGNGCTRSGMVSDYFQPLKGSHLDTRFYVMDSGKPGITAVVLGGTHANEPAGTVAAQILVEHAQVRAGKLIVIPHANPSAASVKDTRCGIPQRHELTTPSGIRYMNFGDRRTDPGDHSWAERGKRSRNLNRVWPGDAQGNPTQQLAHGLFTLIQKEKPDFLVDFHEARTPDGSGRYRLANSLITHPKGVDIGAMALLDLEEESGLTLKLESTTAKSKGLSHWEIGSRTECIPFITESPNPAQDTWRENPDVLNDPDMPLKMRVAIHLRLLIYLGAAVADETDRAFAVQGVPAYGDLMKNGAGYYLN
ncbi:MAG: succinylglutamate desuccinylase/aspartoacylase family protein [Desulfobacterales bacterium]|nr:succinylglutamate desuccinylase/aspartoacylase family protein [Desulfobacterales bacterium]